MYVGASGNETGSAVGSIQLHKLAHLNVGIPKRSNLTAGLLKQARAGELEVARGSHHLPGALDASALIGDQNPDLPRRHARTCLHVERSFALGRWLSRRWRAKQKAKKQTAQRTAETRQQRRARQRRELK
jgi:hypothetical protein